jgi:hypothetical protein
VAIGFLSVNKKMQQDVDSQLVTQRQDSQKFPTYCTSA